MRHLNDHLGYNGIGQTFSEEAVKSGGQKNYLIGSSLLTIVISYSTLVYSNAGRSLIGLCEFSLVALIVVIGTRLCFLRSPLSADSFVVDFVCVSFPVSLKVTLATWSAYWALMLSYDEVINWMMNEKIDPPLWMAYFDKYYARTLIFLTNVFNLLVFYLIMLKHFTILQRLRSSEVEE